MLKYVAAIVALVFGTALAAAQAPYDNDQIARIKQEVDQRRTPDQSVAPAPQHTPDANYATDARPEPCATCPQPRPHYDNVEVVKTSRDVDQSRVINTESVVVVPPRKKEINKLIIRENETRNVGVVQHNHTIIEKEIRYVKRRAPVYPAYRVQTTYQPVCQNGALAYWIVRRGGEAMVVTAEQWGYGNPCHRPCDCGGSVEAYAPRHFHKHNYGYDVPSRTIHVPVQAYGAYR